MAGCPHINAFRPASTFCFKVFVTEAAILHLFVRERSTYARCRMNLKIPARRKENRHDQECGRSGTGDSIGDWSCIIGVGFFSCGYWDGGDRRLHPGRRRVDYGFDSVLSGMVHHWNQHLPDSAQVKSLANRSSSGQVWQLTG